LLDRSSHERLSLEIRRQVALDRSVLNQLRDEIRVLKPTVRRIQPRVTAAVSIVATDGGNNQLRFDPFLVQLVRVVDSNENEYCLEAISPTTSLAQLNSRQYGTDGSPPTALGSLMTALGVSDLSSLSHMIRDEMDGRPRSPSWVQVYRELVEWAILYAVLKKDFASDTLIVFDGQLRSKVFARDLFTQYQKLLNSEIERQCSSRRWIYLVGLAKSSKVLARYRLAMALEQILRTPYPAFVEIPREIEEKAYVWSEYARGDDRVIEGGELNKFVMGKMFFVKFGARPRDPVWPVDVFLPQREEADRIFGYLLNDAINGFPIPLYPRSLQKAHEHAALVDFDMDVLQDLIFESLRGALGRESMTLDAFRLEDADPAQARYG
jgi:hypothetical protein